MTTTLIKEKLPSFNVKNIKVYYWLALLFNGWFILPNWFFFYSQHLTISQIGIVEGIAILTGILLEVPSGAMADMIGKKKTLIVGSIAIIISCLLLINAKDFIDFIIGEMIMFVGIAMHSGATEAFGYDSLVEKKLTDKYDIVIGKYTSIAIFGTIVSTFVGGFLYRFSPTAPFYAWIVFMILSIVVLLYSSEPNVSDHKTSIKSYWEHVKEGTRGLFNKDLRVFLVPILTIGFLIKLYQGMVRQSMAAYFTFSGETFGYIFALVTIPAVFLSFRFNRIKAYLGEKRLITVNLIGFLVAFALAIVLRSPFVGALIFLLLAVNENLSQPLIASIINRTISSKHRATTLSTLALFSQIPYIILVFRFASMVETENIVNLFQWYVGMIAVGLGYFILTAKKNTMNRGVLNKIPEKIS